MKRLKNVTINVKNATQEVILQIGKNDNKKVIETLKVKCKVINHCNYNVTQSVTWKNL
jgi:hypothetical protein